MEAFMDELTEQFDKATRHAQNYLATLIKEQENATPREFRRIEKKKAALIKFFNECRDEIVANLHTNYTVHQTREKENLGPEKTEKPLGSEDENTSPSLSRGPQ